MSYFTNKDILSLSLHLIVWKIDRTMHITKPETSSSNSLHEQVDFAYLIMLIQDMLSGFIAISAIPLIYPVEPTP